MKPKSWLYLGAAALSAAQVAACSKDFTSCEASRSCPLPAEDAGEGGAATEPAAPAGGSAGRSAGTAGSGQSESGAAGAGALDNGGGGAHGDLTAGAGGEAEGGAAGEGETTCGMVNAACCSTGEACSPGAACVGNICMCRLRRKKLRIDKIRAPISVYRMKEKERGIQPMPGG